MEIKTDQGLVSKIIAGTNRVIMYEGKMPVFWGEIVKIKNGKALIRKLEEI